MQLEEVKFRLMSETVGQLCKMFKRSHFCQTIPAPDVVYLILPQYTITYFNILVEYLIEKTSTSLLSVDTV